LRFTQHLIETLSLTLSWEAQNPPNPITHAALQHSLQDLIREFQALDREFRSPSEFY